jgi:hypothetical protein
VLQELDQVGQAERAADDHLGGVRGDTGLALARLEQDHQGTGMVAPDPGVDGVALAGGDVDDDRGRRPGRPGHGPRGQVEARDPDPPAGDGLEARAEERIT